LCRRRLIVHFLVLFGPPAVGKMTVGDEITRLTGIPVFHNHLSIEPVLRFFPFGTPPFGRLVDSFRVNLMEEVAHSDLPGLIFTFVWSLDYKDDEEFVAEICRIFDEVGADIALVELKADLQQRLYRNKTDKRLAEKPSKRDTEASDRSLLEIEERHRMNSDGSVPLGYRHLVIDNTNRTAEEVALEIVDTLGIPRSS
jgi:hypothetical protein